MRELNPNSSWWIHRCGLLAGGCDNSRRNCNSWWIHRCWTVSWWLWHPVGVESPTADLGHQFFFPPSGPQLVPLYFVLLLAEVAGEQMAQPLPYPTDGRHSVDCPAGSVPRLSPSWSFSSFVSGGGRRGAGGSTLTIPTYGRHSVDCQDQSPGSHRLVHPLVEVAGEQTARPLPYPPTGGIRLTVQQDQSPGSHRLVHSAPLFLVEVAGEQVAQPLPYPPTGGIRLTVQLDQSLGSRFPLLGIT